MKVLKFLSKVSGICSGLVTISTLGKINWKKFVMAKRLVLQKIL